MNDVAASMWDWFYTIFVVQFSLWIALGFIAQFLFMMRFLIQWIASERARRSVMPVAFWFFSLGGGVLLFVYAIHRRDPVFIVGQGLGVFIYIRNLWLIAAERRNPTTRDDQSLI